MAQQKWYLKSQGKKIGPLTTEQLKQLLTQFREDNDTMILKEGWNKWQRAVDLISFLQGGFDFSGSDTKTVSTLPVAGQDWYLYINRKQEGPHSLDKINQCLEGKTNRDSVYLFHRSWKEWRHLLEVPKTMLDGTESPFGNTQKEKDERRAGGNRAPIAGSVVAHNDQVVSVVSANNISKSGLFIASDEHVFYVGEVVKLTVKCPSLASPFHTKAEIVRYGSNSRGLSGYALKFVGLTGILERHIEKYVDRHVTKKSKSSSYASAS